MNTSWPTLTEAVFACEKCRLCQTRTNVVLGEGDLHAPLMFIGEGPGQQEDLSGRPFVGAAGQLLDKMLAAIGLKREQVYICNIVKCRPPQNRNLVLKAMRFISIVLHAPIPTKASKEEKIRQTTMTRFMYIDLSFFRWFQKLKIFILILLFSTTIRPN